MSHKSEGRVTRGPNFRISTQIQGLAEFVSPKETICKMSFSKVAQPSRPPSNLFSFPPVQAGRLRYIWTQERAGQELKRKIQSQRLNATGCKPRRLLTVRNERFQTKPAIAHCIIRFVFCCSGRVGILGGLDFQT